MNKKRLLHEQKNYRPLHKQKKWQTFAMVYTAPGLETGLLTARYRVPFPTSLKKQMSSMK